MCARRIRLHDRQPTKRHAQRIPRQHGADARGKTSKECHRARQIADAPSCLLGAGAGVGVGISVCGREGHHAEGEVQAARVDDDGRVEALDGRFVRQPGGRQRRHGVAELGVMADREGQEMGRSRVYFFRVVAGGRPLLLWRTASLPLLLAGIGGGGTVEIVPC